jgi:hypothetical protein
MEKAVNMHDFKAAVNEGLTRTQLLTKFPTLTISDIKSIVKREKLSITRDYTPKFELEPVITNDTKVEEEIESIILDSMQLNNTQEETFQIEEVDSVENN